MYRSEQTGQRVQGADAPFSWAMGRSVRRKDAGCHQESENSLKAEHICGHMPGLLPNAPGNAIFRRRPHQHSAGDVRIRADVGSDQRILGMLPSQCLVWSAAPAFSHPVFRRPECGACTQDVRTKQARRLVRFPDQTSVPQAAQHGIVNFPEIY